MPKVLVLLATYNGRPWLAVQCESILRQTGVEVHIVASDDGSSDGSREYLLALEEQDPRVTLLPAAERSGSAGRNFYRLIRDVDASSFDFIAFADQDDDWHADKLSRGCRALAARPSTGGYSSAVQAVYPDGRRHLLRQSPDITPVDFLFEGAGQGCTFVLSATLFHRVQSVVTTARDQVQQVHHHDWMVYALCRAFEFDWHFDAVPSMEYRQHGGNELGGRGSLAGVLKRWQMLRRGWYSEQVDAVVLALSSVGLGGRVHHLVRERSSRRGVSERLAWVWLLCKVGRRKTMDRAVLVVAALFGYL